MIVLVCVCVLVDVAHVVWILHLSGCLPVPLHNSSSQTGPGHILNSLPLHLLLLKVMLIHTHTKCVCVCVLLLLFLHGCGERIMVNLGRIFLTFLSKYNAHFLISFEAEDLARAYKYLLLIFIPVIIRIVTVTMATLLLLFLLSLITITILSMFAELK